MLSVLPVALGYVLCSSMMMVANKWALSLFQFPGTLMVVQFIFSAMIVRLLGVTGQLECEPLSLRRAKSFLLVPAAFCVAIFTNMKLLQSTSVETAIVFRTLVPLLTSWGDYAFMGRAAPTVKSAIGLATIVIGAVGYAACSNEGILVRVWLWAVAYLLVLAFEMVYVKHVLNAVPMGTWTRVYYNNALALLFMPPMMAVSDEHRRLPSALYTLWMSHKAGLAVSASCALGLGISFTGFHFRALVSATTFTVVGVMNKILTVLMSMLLLASSGTSPSAVCALLVCIIGGTLYQQAPMRVVTSGTAPSDAGKVAALPPAASPATSSRD